MPRFAHFENLANCRGIMAPVPAFAAKLDMVLKTESLSRVALAQKLAVDKSLVGRWLSGAVHLTEHNLARLTELIAVHHADFRLADWYAETRVFAARFHFDLPCEQPSELASALPQLGPLIAMARAESTRRGTTYEGFWRTTRPSVLMNDRVFHDYGMIRKGEGNLLEVRMLGSGLSFEGWVLPVAGNLFVYLYDAVGLTPMSLVFRGVSLPRAMVLDGLLLMAALDAARTPAAIPILLERVGDLTGDCDADDEYYRTLELTAPEPLEPIPDAAVRTRLCREVGAEDPTQAGVMYLTVRQQDSLSRGSTLTGLTG